MKKPPSITGRIRSGYFSSWVGRFRSVFSLSLSLSLSFGIVSIKTQSPKKKKVAFQFSIGKIKRTNNYRRNIRRPTTNIPSIPSRNFSFTVECFQFQTECHPVGETEKVNEFLLVNCLLFFFSTNKENDETVSFYGFCFYNRVRYRLVDLRVQRGFASVDRLNFCCNWLTCFCL